MDIRLQDIADYLGCSKSTVSLALRGDRRITPSRQAEVREAAARLGYRPKHAFGALVSAHKTGKEAVFRETVALLLPGDAIWSTFYHEAQSPPEISYRSLLKSLGYGLDVFPVPHARSEQIALGRTLYYRGIRGLIIQSDSIRKSQDAEIWHHFAAVTVSGSSPDDLRHAVLENHFEDQKRVLCELHKRSYKRPVLAFVEDYEKHAHFDGEPWQAAYEYGSRHWYGMEPLKPLIYHSKNLTKQVRESMRQDKVDVIISSGYGDEIIDLLRMQGIAVPDDIGVCGLDLRTPKGVVSGIFQSREAAHGRAVDLLTALLRRHEIGPVNAPIRLLVPGMWNEGKSLRK